MTATVILPPGADRAEWLTARRHGIGGSDIGAILGASPWTTPLDVWADKTGLTEPQPASPAMKVGNALEAGVLTLGAAWLRDTFAGDWWRDDPPALLRSQTHPVAQYSPDGLIHGSDATWLMEAKITSKYLDEPAPHWVAQVQWGLGILGLDRALISMVNGSRENHWIIDADPAWFTNAADYATTWWADHVTANTPPGADPARDDLTIFRTADPALAVELDAQLVRALADARAAKKTAEDAEKAAVAAVKSAMGDATTGMIDGAPAVTWKPGTRTAVDTDALKAAGIYQQYAITKPTAGSVLIKKGAI
jgi:putative phage-type endonuclease